MPRHDGTQRARVGWQPDGSVVVIAYRFIPLWNLPDCGMVWARFYDNGETIPCVTMSNGGLL